MKLTDLIENIETKDQDAIIFQENLEDLKSDIILSHAEDATIEENGKKYHYLIEVFLATEFIEDWISSLKHHPSNEEIAQRLYEYAINDA